MSACGILIFKNSLVGIQRFLGSHVKKFLIIIIIKKKAIYIWAIGFFLLHYPLFLTPVEDDPFGSMVRWSGPSTNGAQIDLPLQQTTQFPSIKWTAQIILKNKQHWVKQMWQCSLITPCLRTYLSYFRDENSCNGSSRVHWTHATWHYFGGPGPLHPTGLHQELMYCTGH